MHCILQNAFLALHSMHCILCILIYALYSMHIFYALYYLHCIICIVLYAMYFMHCVIWIVSVFYLLQHMHYMLCIVFYELCSMHELQIKTQTGRPTNRPPNIERYKAVQKFLSWLKHFVVINVWLTWWKFVLEGG